MKEGKLLGHIISQEGIRIDMKRVEAINRIELPQNKFEVQLFLGKVNFIRRFIAALAEIVKYITNMIGKYQDIRSTPEAKQTFEGMKWAIAEATYTCKP